MTQELGRDTPAWLLPVPKWWMSFCHVTRGQSRTSRLSRVNSHTSALVDMEIWVHMETKEDNDRMKSCSDMCVCVLCMYSVCTRKQAKKSKKSNYLGCGEPCQIPCTPSLSHLGLLCVCVCMLVTQSCPTLCDPMDCSPPGFSVRGILQIRILEYWVAIPFSRGFSRPRDRPGSPELQADYLPYEPTRNIFPLFGRQQSQVEMRIALIYNSRRGLGKFVRCQRRFGIC